MKKEAIHHFILGVVLMLKGYDKFSHHPITGGLILLFGIIIIVYFIYDLKVKNQGHVLKFLVHLFEGFALLFTSFVFFEEGKKYLPYFTLCASIIFFVWSFTIYFKQVKNK